MSSGILRDLSQVLDAGAELFPDPWVRRKNPDVEMAGALFLDQGDFIRNMQFFQGFFRTGKDIADLGTLFLSQFRKGLNMPICGDDQEAGNRDLRIPERPLWMMPPGILTFPLTISQPMHSAPVFPDADPQTGLISIQITSAPLFYNNRLQQADRFHNGISVLFHS